MSDSDFYDENDALLPIAENQTAQSADVSSMQLEQRTTSKNNLIGMCLITAATWLLMTAYALLKYTTDDINVSLFECITITNFMQHCIAWLLWYLPSEFTKKQDYVQLWYGEAEYRYNIWFRGFFYWADLYLYWYGITLMPLGDAEAIYYLCPIFVVLGARIFLKEQFSKMFPIIFTFTVIGLTIMCQPKFIVDWFDASANTRFESRSINGRGIIMLIGGCVAWAGMSLMVRSAKKAHWIQLEIVSSLQAFAIWTPLLVLINRFIDTDDFNLDTNGAWMLGSDLSGEVIGLTAIISLLTVLALMLIVVGYQYGEATKVAWMEYMLLPFGFVYQIMMFGVMPNIYEITGIVIVLSTCLLSIAEEYYNYVQLQNKDDDQPGPKEKV
eukprot:54682_1